MANGNQTLKVFSIREREGAPNFWLQLGVAWINKDGSTNLTLNALPLDNRLHIRAKKGETSPFEPTEERLAAYAITERAETQAIWTEVGAAFVNKDGSMNVLLRALPITGRLHIRVAEKNDQGEHEE